MGKKLYLVTGATGFTGKYTVNELLKNDRHVRAFVHEEDLRSEALKKRGVEIQVGDLLDFESVRKAVEGVAGAYFVYPIKPGLIEATTYFAQAAKEAKLEIVVNMSQISARREATSHGAFNHWLAERVFDWSGIPVSHLRPTFFAEWLLYPMILDGNKKGLVEYGWSSGKHAPIAAEEQARFIAALLENPSPHVGKTYPLYGPKEYTATELYAEISRVLGRKVRYRTIPENELREKISSYMGPFITQHLVEVVKDHTNGIFEGTDSIIEEVTGKAPMGVEEFVNKHRQAFTV
jgi:NAD(P)H dehydrogenase (quinone)